MKIDELKGVPLQGDRLTKLRDKIEELREKEPESENSKNLRFYKLRLTWISVVSLLWSVWSLYAVNN